MISMGRAGIADVSMCSVRPECVSALAMYRMQGARRGDCNGGLSLYGA
ncbi:hypothetical protein C7S15_5653 [Burkholderia cepacia]|nr:hypothetical protein [Burkholderia cepacia]